MKTKHLLAIALIFLSVCFIDGKAQQTITLKQCHENADSLFPLAFQKARNMKNGELENSNLKAGFLPQIDLNVTFSYQSNVVEINFPSNIPGLSSPAVPHEQYGATLELKQLIYDGGSIKQAKNVNKHQTATKIQKVEVDLYKLKEQVTKLYFYCLILQENAKIIDLAKENILKQKKVLEASVKNGILNEAELFNLEAELLKLDQQIIEIESNKKQTFKALSELSCTLINPIDSLIIPQANLPETPSIHRPEHQLFEQQRAVLDANIKLSSTQRMPKLVAFGTGGMGYPGLNIFSESIEPYYIVGAQLSWKVWDWKQTKRKKEQLSIQKQLINDSKQAYDKNLNIQISEAQTNIDKLSQLISKDKEIIELRENITHYAASQLKNGTKTSAEYLNELNAEKKARISLTTHEIILAQSRINLLMLAGNEANIK